MREGRTWGGEVVHLIVEDDACCIGDDQGAKVGVDCGRHGKGSPVACAHLTPSAFLFILHL